MPTEFSRATDVEAIAGRLIASHHPHLRSLRVDYVFVHKRDKDGVPQPWEAKGKLILGQAKKVSGLNAFLAGGTEAEGSDEFFVILISHFTWRMISPEKREAATDHFLCYCEVDVDTSALKLLPPDVEEFTAVVRRHGLWQSDLESLVRAGAERLNMPLLEIAEGDGAKPAGKKGATKAAKAKAAKAEAPGH